MSENLLSKILLSEKEVAAVTGFSRIQLERWRNGPKKAGPKWFKVGWSVKYHRDDVDAWLRDHGGRL